MKIDPSYWESKHFYQHKDVVIIGSGIVGLTAALRIKTTAPSLNVTILERGHLPAGASTKNAGFACFGSISELIDFEARSSTLELYDLVKLRWEGLELLRRNIGDKALQFQQLGGYEIFRNDESALADQCCDKIEYYNELLTEAVGAKSIYSVATSKIKSFGFQKLGCMIQNRLEGQIDTGSMMAALLAKVSGLGVQIHTDTAVVTITRTDHGHSIKTNHGTYESKYVILATNAFAKELFPALDVVPGRGQVLVTRPISNLKIAGTFHYQHGYYYFRNIDNRLLLGGGRNLNFKGEETYEPGITEEIQSALEDLIKSVIIPGTEVQVEQRWSGVMGFGSDVHPIIQEFEPGLFCAVRCNGMGVALGSISGTKVGDMVLSHM